MSESTATVREYGWGEGTKEIDLSKQFLQCAAMQYKARGS